MFQTRKLTIVAAGLFGFFLVAPACANVNKSITIGDNTETGSESTVNGSITVGDGATVNGSLDTVNGTIRVGENTRVRDIDTVNGSIRLASGVTADDVGSVNGSIRLGENVTIDGEIDVVNGKITVGEGSSVSDDVQNVNGEINLSGAEVGGDVSTVSGDIQLENRARINGDIVVEKPGGWGRENRKPRVIIGPGSVVVGQIHLEREVELYISETAEVGGVTGEMSMDDAVRFSGERP
jgi:DUF4097 and DUF4098 domain-containing protein YvlB